MNTLGMRVNYTKDDDDNFHYTAMSEDERQRLISQRAYNFRIKFLTMILFSLVGVIIGFTCHSGDGQLSFFLLYFGVLVLSVFVYMFEDLRDIQMMKKKRAVTYEVIVIKKYDIEDVTYLLGNNSKHVALYPIYAKDVTTGYESKLFIPREVYNHCICNQVIKLTRFM